MPFTFSHPAIVLPFNYFNKKYISFAGLVTGSMVPDFDYFISMKKGNIFKSHSWPGLLWFDLPLGLLLLVIFYSIVYKPLINNLPTPLKARVWVYKDFDWKAYFKTRWLVIMVSVLIGSVLHILWDKLTHESIHYLDEVVTFTDVKASPNYRNPYYFFSWNLNSLLGLLFLALAFWRLPADTTVNTGKKIWPYWLLISGFAVLIFSIRVWEQKHLSTSDFVVTLIAGFLYSLILTSLLFGFLFHQKHQSGFE